MAGGEADPVAKEIQLTIIVPVLNEAAGIVALLQSLQAMRAAGAEIIVVDGGSSDSTVQLALPLADQLITSATGRARQMNAGAEISRAPVLLFLHADTQLPEGAMTQLVQAIQQGALWGRFDVKISGTASGLGLIGTMMNLRSRLSGIATGDQAIFVRCDVFNQLGGFPDLPLMEDISFSRQMKRLGRPACLSEKVITSGRRWEKHGVLRTILLMLYLGLRFFFGADPADLAREYGYVPRQP
jgi:rSAM/selenodomain-associated transferase 2